MKALVGAFNQEKALVGAFSVIVQPVVEPMDRFTALVIMSSILTAASLLVPGGPGSGKGSQCEILAYKRNFKHISGGDLLRHEASVFIIGVDFYKS